MKTATKEATRETQEHDPEPQLYLYRIDLKTGNEAHAIDSRTYAAICAEFLITRASLASLEKTNPDPRSSPEALLTAARETGWLFLQTGMWEVKKIEGISVEICPPEDLLEEFEDALAAKREQHEDDEDEEEEEELLRTD